MGEVTAFVHRLETNAFSRISARFWGKEEASGRVHFPRLPLLGLRGLAASRFAGVLLK